ncbi:unnamed protein product [Candida verbasci]|uniref:ribonuclease Z n=1 Tax=Candida verbasci TaxID=1227364 RepID=A0A9W4TZ97_9ASCO|nr:unnamed protein product [Candida verbasci]
MFKFTTINHINNDTSRPLINLTTKNGSRFLFGKVPEGSQRIINSITSDLKFTKLEGLFITGSIFSWSDIGGLPGLFLTISDATKKNFNVFGNSKLLNFIVCTWRYFVFRLGIKLNIYDTDEPIKNEEFIVYPIKIKPNKTNLNSDVSFANKLSIQVKKLASLMFPLDTSEVNSMDLDSYKKDTSKNDIQTHVELPKASQIVNTQDSYNYIIDFVPIRGKFDVQKAISLGVQPGPLFKQLTEGKPVLNKEGVEILPDQVIGQSKSFPKVLIVDIPNEAYFENTINSIELVQDGIGLVYHFLGDDVNFNLQEYKEKFISRFSNSTNHVISHKSISNNVIINEKFISNLIQLKSLMNENFNFINSEEFKEFNSDNISSLHTLQQFIINDTGVNTDFKNVAKATNKSICENEVQPLNIPESISYETMNETPLFNLYPESTNSLTDLIHVCTLGTGSALPSIHRNVISTLIRIPHKSKNGDISYKAILLDGGENTIGSLLRNFGHNNNENFNNIFKELSLIYLSHLHADHHLGLVSIINKWFDMNSENDSKLYLIVPWQFETFLNDWYSLEGQYHPFFNWQRLEFFGCESFLVETRLPEYRKISLDEFEHKFDNSNTNNLKIIRKDIGKVDKNGIKSMFNDLNLIDVGTIRAIHCPWAYSVTFNFKLDSKTEESFKVSYSGDTRPNPNFVKIGLNSDLLIHEASLDSNWIEEAINKKHTTMLEALQICKLLKCKKLLLTHFSTRYGNSNNCIFRNELPEKVKELKNYLNTDEAEVYNVFNDDNDFNYDITMVYAYDLMNVRMGQDFKNQESKWKILNDIFEISATINEDKINLKKEQKRNERVALMSKKKRRISPVIDN